MFWTEPIHFLCWIIFSSTTTNGRLGTLPNTYNGVLRKTVNSFKLYITIFETHHCVKSILIRSYSGPHFSRIFPHSNWIQRDTLYLSVFSSNVGKFGKNADQNTPNKDTFYAVHLEHLTMSWMYLWSQIHYYHHG